MRNLQSGYWRGWLKPEFRCVVPATSFCEYDERHAKRPTWFALGEDKAALRLRRHLATLDWHPRHQGLAGRGRTPALRLPDHGGAVTAILEPWAGDAVG
ncbi:MAG TPA: hypothetical protein VEX11_05345 [Acetobacteraceae bacterium]|nr:hypothetical protein [Acetobacteraceae bacterium]